MGGSRSSGSPKQYRVSRQMPLELTNSQEEAERLRRHESLVEQVRAISALSIKSLMELELSGPDYTTLNPGHKNPYVRGWGSSHPVREWPVELVWTEVAEAVRSAAGLNSADMESLEKSFGGLMATKGDIVVALLSHLGMVPLPVINWTTTRVAGDRPNPGFQPMCQWYQQVLMEHALHNGYLPALGEIWWVAVEAETLSERPNRETMSRKTFLTSLEQFRERSDISLDGVMKTEVPRIGGRIADLGYRADHVFLPRYMVGYWVYHLLSMIRSSGYSQFFNLQAKEVEIRRYEDGTIDTSHGSISYDRVSDRYVFCGDRLDSSLFDREETGTWLAMTLGGQFRHSTERYQSRLAKSCLQLTPSQRSEDLSFRCAVMLSPNDIDLSRLMDKYAPDSDDQVKDVPS